MKIVKENQGRIWYFYSEEDKFLGGIDIINAPQYLYQYNGSNDCMIGLRKKYVKTKPTTLNLITTNKCMSLITNHYYKSAYEILIKLIDTLVSLGYDNFANIDGLTYSLLDRLEEEFKQIIKYIQNHYNPQDQLNVYDALYGYAKEKKEQACEKLYKQFNFELSEADKRYIQNTPRDYDKRTKIIINYVHNFMSSETKYFIDKTSWYSIHTACEQMADNYLTYAKFLGLRARTNINLCIENQYIDEYLSSQKMSLSDMEIGCRQREIPIAYANDKFEVYVPTTHEEFSEEGARMRNCMSSWGKSNVLSGDMIVGFVRKLGETTSILDLSVLTEDLQIDQYFKKCNVRPDTDSEEDRALREFKVEYQNYLNTLR